MRIIEDTKGIKLEAEDDYESNLLGKLYINVTSHSSNAASLVIGELTRPVEAVNIGGHLYDYLVGVPRCDAEVVQFHPYEKPDTTYFINGVYCG